MRERVETAQNMDDYVGKYYSINWLRKNVLMQTEEDIRQIDKEVEKEEAAGEEEGVDVFGGNDNDEEPQQVNGKDQNQQQRETLSPSPVSRLKTIKMVNRKNSSAHSLINEDVE